HDPIGNEETEGQQRRHGQRHVKVPNDVRNNRAENIRQKRNDEENQQDHPNCQCASCHGAPRFLVRYSVSVTLLACSNFPASRPASLASASVIISTGSISRIGSNSGSHAGIRKDCSLASTPTRMHLNPPLLSWLASL